MSDIKALLPDGCRIVLGPKMEFMRMPNGQWGERITHPDGAMECWLDGESSEPAIFEDLLKQPYPKSSIWKVSW